MALLAEKAFVQVSGRSTAVAAARIRGFEQQLLPPQVHAAAGKNFEFRVRIAWQISE